MLWEKRFRRNKENLSAAAVESVAAPVRVLPEKNRKGGNSL